MKKFLSITLCVLSVICACAFVSCKNDNLYLQNVSQLRLDVFIGDYNGNTLTIYPEEKEYPFIYDGNACERKCFVTIKLDNLTSDEIYAEFVIDNETYGSQMVFQVLPNALMCTVEVPTLPQKSLTVSITQNDSIVKVDTKSVRIGDTVSYKTAINSVFKQKKDFIKTLKSHNVLQAEIQARLLCEDGKNYWYIGFADKKGNLTAFLIDGKDGKILAEKSQPAQPRPR